MAVRSILTVDSDPWSLGVERTIVANTESSNVTHTLTWLSGSYSGTICTKSSDTSWDFTPAIQLASEAPNGDKVYCEFKLDTYSGNTLVGTYMKYVWFNIPTSLVPTCSISVSDANGYLELYENYIQKYSAFHCDITASGSVGSRIIQYSTTVNGQKFTTDTFDTDILKKAGPNVITTEVTDSRGRKATATTTITVLSYSNPIISHLSVRRCDLDGTPNDLGTHAKVTYMYNVDKLDYANDVTPVLSYKKSNSDTWTNITLNDDDPYVAVNESYILDNIDDTSVYNIKLTVTDSFNTVTRSTNLSVGYCLYHIPSTGQGITFGGVAPGDGFNVYMPSYFAGGITEDIPVLVSGNCNNITTSGHYYLGNEVINKPVNTNGWLSVKSYATNYCYQRYMTYEGVEYYRMKDNGTWGSWIQITPSDIVISTGTVSKTSPATSYDSTGSITWTYRKWKSKIAECWGLYSGTVDATVNNQYGFRYSNILTIDYPFAFSSRPVLTVDGGGTNSAHFPRDYGGTSTDAKTKAMFRVLCHDSSSTLSSQSVTLSLYAIGKYS